MSADRFAIIIDADTLRDSMTDEDRAAIPDLTDEDLSVALDAAIDRNKHWWAAYDDMMADAAANARELQLQIDTYEKAETAR